MCPENNSSPQGGLRTTQQNNAKSDHLAIIMKEDVEPLPPSYEQSVQNINYI